MLDEHIQLNQPLTFPEPFRDLWYVDLVEVTETGDSVSIADHWLDVAVPPAGQPYRVMDGHEFADALLTGQVTAEQVASGLRRFQHFLDRYLHGPLDERGFDAVASSWHDFPPAALEPLISFPI